MLSPKRQGRFLNTPADLSEESLLLQRVYTETHCRDLFEVKKCLYNYAGLVQSQLSWSVGFLLDFFLSHQPADQSELFLVTAGTKWTVLFNQNILHPLRF